MSEFDVVESDGEIIVTRGAFCAVYHKPDKLDPQLKLKRRTHTDDHALLLDHRSFVLFRTANKKARAGVDCLDKQKPGYGGPGLRNRPERLPLVNSTSGSVT